MAEQSPIYSIKVNEPIETEYKQGYVTRPLVLAKGTYKVPDDLSHLAAGAALRTGKATKIVGKRSAAENKAAAGS